MAAGDIGNMIDDLSFSHSYRNHVFNVSSDVVCVACDVGSDPYYKTFGILSNGNINASIDSVCLDASGFGNGHVPCHIIGDLYGSVYRRGDRTGWIATTDIYDNGNIQLIDTHCFESGDMRDAWICKVSDNVCVVVYASNTNNNTIIKTIGIHNKTITGTIDSRVFAIPANIWPQIIRLSGNIFVITHHHAGIYATTVSIDSSGTISTNIDTCYINNGAETRALLKLSNNAFIESDYANRIIMTVGVSGSGLINGVIDTCNISSSSISPVGMSGMYLCKNVYAFVYALQYIPQSGYVKTVSINKNGDIDGVIDYLKFHNHPAYRPTICRVSDNIYAIAHRGYSSSYIRTVDIDTPSGIISPIRFTTGLSHRSFR